MHKLGQEISNYIKNEDIAILEQYGFDPNTGILRENYTLPESIINPVYNENNKKEVAEDILNIIKNYNQTTTETDEQISWNQAIDRIESIPDDTVIICADEVGVSRQKDIRNAPEVSPNETAQYNVDARTGKKKIETAVVYLRSKEGNRKFAAPSIKEVLIQVLAYMLRMNLLENRSLMIFTDGATNIRDNVEKIFSFREFTINLDWYHLRKHCYESLSMALTGGKDNKKRNEMIRHGLEKRLFVGKVDAAKAYLDSLDPSFIKNPKMIKDIKDYLDRKKPYIYIYAIRKGLKIINSSNQGEKTNDIVVAERCKHNGMSWVNKGVTGIYSINLLRINGEEQWFDKHIFTYKPMRHSKIVSKQYNKHVE